MEGAGDIPQHPSATRLEVLSPLARRESVYAETSGSMPKDRSSRYARFMGLVRLQLSMGLHLCSFMFGAPGVLATAGPRMVGSHCPMAPSEMGVPRWMDPWPSRASSVPGREKSHCEPRGRDTLLSPDQ